MKAAQQAPHEAAYSRNREPCFNVFGKARVKAGSERQAAAEAGAPRGPAKRAFGGNVNGLRLDRIYLAANRRCAYQAELDFRIGRNGPGPVALRSNVANVVATLAEFAANGLERPDHAIDLRRPGIGHDQDSHDSPFERFRE